MQKYNRRIMFLTGLVIIFLLVFFHTRVNPDDNGVVATIGDEEITWADFIAFASDIDAPIPDEERMQLLDNMVMQRLVQLYVQRHPGLRDTLEQRFERERAYAHRQLLQREVERYMVDESVQITNADIRRFYEQQDIIALYAVSVSRLDPEASMKVSSALEALKLGRAPQEVIDQYSELPDSSFYGFYVRGLDDNPDRLQEAETLDAEGDFSDIFSADFGPMILIRGETPSLEEARPLIRQTLARLWAQRSESDFSEGLSFSFEIDEDLLRRAALGDTIDADAPVVSYRQTDFTITYQRFAGILYDLFYIEDPSLTSADRLYELAQLIADQEQRLHLAEELALANTLRFRLRWEAYKQALSYEQDAKTYSFVQERMAAVDNREIRAYYDTHKEEYRQPDFYQLQRVVVQTQEQAKEAFSRVLGSGDFSAVVNEMSLEKGYESDGLTGLTALLDKRALSTVYDSLAAHQVGDVLSPLPTDDDRWQIVRIHKRVQGAVRPYDLVQPYIMQTLQMAKWSEWLDSLGEDDSLRVETNYDVLLSMQFPPSRQQRPTQ